jgi:hypothetical protein
MLQNKGMFKKKKKKDSQNNDHYPTMISDLPGLEGKEIFISSPMLIRQNSTRVRYDYNRPTRVPD